MSEVLQCYGESTILKQCLVEPLVDTVAHY